jgi:hypothetical protein
VEEKVEKKCVLRTKQKCNYFENEEKHTNKILNYVDINFVQRFFLRFSALKRKIEKKTGKEMLARAFACDMTWQCLHASFSVKTSSFRRPVAPSVASPN